MSSPRLLAVLVVALLTITSAACADVADRMDDLRSSAEDATGTVRFCLSLARAAAAVETGSPATAADAAEEALVHAPADVRDDARTVVEGIRRAESHGAALDDPEVRGAIERLRDRTRELCDPR